MKEDQDFVVVVCLFFEIARMLGERILIMTIDSADSIRESLQRNPQRLAVGQREEFPSNAFTATYFPVVQAWTWEL